MEFPAGALTNVLTVNGFSNIYWRILYNEDLQPQSPGAASPLPASNAALSSISRLKELELKLRNLRCLAAHLPKSFGLLVFSTEPNFNSIQSLYRQDDANSNRTISIGGSILRSSVTSSITSIELVKHLVTDPQTSLPVNSGFQENSQGLMTPNSMEILPSYSTFYEAFISAITGAVSLDLTRRHKLIPLGSRTFFTTTSQSSYENKRTTSDGDLETTSVLATLDIEMMFTGDLVVGLRAIHQPGLERLSSDNISFDSALSQHNVDLWLAPNGAIARLLPEGGVKSTSISPGVSVSNYGDEGEKRLDEASRQEWKQNVSQWLETFGISAPEADEDSWVEVEVLSSFNAKSINSGLRHAGFETPQLAPKRILWPSELCFSRTKSLFPSAKEFLRCFIVPTEDPLDFAEKWLASAESRNKSLKETGSGDEVSKLHQEEQTKQSVSSPQKAEVPEALDSLARSVNFPDFQSGNSVYPTPPDGTLIHNLGTVPSSDGIGASANDGAYVTMPQIQNDGLPGKDNTMSSTKDNDVLMAGFGAQPSTYAIGSGLYDTGVDDEDLFGGMDEANFGSKGITEADFNFFDEPDLGDLAEGIGITNPGQFPEQDQIVTSEPEAEQPDVLPAATKPEEPYDWKNSQLGTNDSALERSTAKEGHSPSVASNTSLFKLPEAAKSQLQDGAPHGRSQTLSPPLSPVEIKKILFSDHHHIPPKHSTPLSPGHSASQKRGHYRPIPFQRTLSYSDQKYSAAGRFWFPPEGINSQGASQSAKDSSDIPTVGLPKGGRKPAKSKSGYTPHTNPDFSPADAGEDEIDRSHSSSDESDDESDVLSETGAPPSFFAGGLKRKRVESNLDESTTSSLEKLCLSNELLPSNTGVAEGSSKFLGNFLSGSIDWSFAGFFSLQESHTSPALARRDNYIQLAQLLVDQVTQSSFNHKLDGLSRLAGTDHPKYSMHSLLQGGDTPGQTSRLTMEDLITTPGTEATQSTNHKQTNPLQRNDINGSIAKIPPPHIRIRRGNSCVEVLPPAIAFWETFGLEPAKGKKNIISYCIHPHDTAEGADAFLERIGSAYSSCKLGTHSRGSSTQAFDDGLVSWNVDHSEDTNYQTVMDAIRSICEVLGSILSKIPPSDDNILVYIVNPFSNAVAMADLCSAFLSLFQRYIGDVDRQNVRQLHEIVLQVIPIDFVSSLESIVVPPQVEYLNLALEVYNRCPPNDSPCDLAGSAAALTLSKSPPKAIDFKLLPDQSSPLQESRCLHVAYSLSSDQRWVTASWTDKTGSFQMTMSYCLRNKSSSVSRLISSVRQEIWETSRDIMEKFQTRWKIFLVRDEPVEGEEVEAWVSFANQQNHTRPTKVELIILSADTNPGLVLESSSQLPGGIVNNIHGSTGTMTPVATPSPDPTSGAANAPTPTEQPFDSEPDTTLIDVSDETWGAILSRRLNNSHTLLEYHPALASGYLIRRKGISDNDGAVTMSVNLVHVHQGHGVHCEALLKDVLHMYRDLGTLARAKGLSHVRHNTLPWHIASAVKGQEIMSYVL